MSGMHKLRKLHAGPMLCAAFCIGLSLPLCSAAAHEGAATKERTFFEIGVEEKPGTKIPGDAVFLDEGGNRVTLGALVTMPTVVLPVFYSCPQTCGLLLSNLAAALESVPQMPGRDYRVLALSIDDEEDPGSALRAKGTYVNKARTELRESWAFLTGDRATIERVTGALGFHFKKTGKHAFAHPNVLIVLARDGAIIRYLHGPFFLPFDIGMALAEATKGTPGISVRKLLSYCYSYDPEKRTYAFTAVRFLGLGSLVLIGLLMAALLRKRGPK